MGEAKRRQLLAQTQALEAMTVDTPGLAGSPVAGQRAGSLEHAMDFGNRHDHQAFVRQARRRAGRLQTPTSPNAPANRCTTDCLDWVTAGFRFIHDVHP